MLARTYHDPAASAARREATVVVFEAFHRLPRRRDRRVSRLPPHRSVDRARRRGNAPVLRIRPVACLARDHDRRPPRRRLGRIRRQLRGEGLENSPVRSSPSPTPHGRSGWRAPGSSFSLPRAGHPEWLVASGRLRDQSSWSRASHVVLHRPRMRDDQRRSACGPRRAHDSSRACRDPERTRQDRCGAAGAAHCKTGGDTQSQARSQKRPIQARSQPVTCRPNQGPRPKCLCRHVRPCAVYAGDRIYRVPRLSGGQSLTR
jgi:hypothetical protein